MEQLVQKWVLESAQGRHVDQPYISKTVSCMSSTNTFYETFKGVDYVDEHGVKHPGKFATIKWYILLDDKVRLHADNGPAVFTVMIDRPDGESFDNHWYKFGLCIDHEELDDNDPDEILDWFLSNGSDEPLIMQRLVNLGAKITDDAIVDAASNDLVNTLDFFLSKQQVVDREALLVESVINESIRVLNYFLNTGLYNCNEVLEAISDNIKMETDYNNFIETSVRHAIAENSPCEDTLVQCLVSNTIQHYPYFYLFPFVQQDKVELIEFLVTRGGLCVPLEVIYLARDLGRYRIVALLEQL